MLQVCVHWVTLVVDDLKTVPAAGTQLNLAVLFDLTVQPY